MKRILSDFVTYQTNRICGCKGGGLLSERALACFSNVLYEIAEIVASSTLKGYISDEVLPDNPFAVNAPELITSEQRERALDTLERKIRNGELSLPKPLVEIMELRLSNVTDTFLEMLGHMETLDLMSTEQIKF